MNMSTETRAAAAQTFAGSAITLAALAQRALIVDGSSADERHAAIAATNHLHTAALILREAFPYQRPAWRPPVDQMQGDVLRLELLEVPASKAHGSALLPARRWPNIATSKAQGWRANRLNVEQRRFLKNLGLMVGGALGAWALAKVLVYLLT